MRHIFNITTHSGGEVGGEDKKATQVKLLALVNLFTSDTAALVFDVNRIEPKFLRTEK